MFQVRLASRGELAAVQRLRAAVYGAEKLADPCQFTADGRYADRNDAWSFNIGAFIATTGELAGCFKVTPRTLGRPLKLEADVPADMLGIQPAERCVEWARLAVLPAYRRLGVAVALWQVAYWVTAEGGYQTIYSIQRKSPLRTLERIGAPVVRLGGQIAVQNNVLVTPTRIRVAEFLPALRRRTPALAAFFSRPLADGAFQPRDLLEPLSGNYRS